MFSGRWLDAATAQQWGLVNVVVPAERLHGEAISYCIALAARSRPGLASMKRLAHFAIEHPLQEGLQAEREAVLRLMQVADPAESIAAFEARRPPHFRA